MSYFERDAGGTRFVPTKHVGGASDTQEQHIGPALGLLAHCVELDRDVRRGHDLVIGRLAYDILGTIPSTSWTSTSGWCERGARSNSWRRPSGTAGGTP